MDPRPAQPFNPPTAPALWRYAAAVAIRAKVCSISRRKRIASAPRRSSEAAGLHRTDEAQMVGETDGEATQAQAVLRRHQLAPDHKPALAGP